MNTHGCLIRPMWLTLQGIFSNSNCLQMLHKTNAITAEPTSPYRSLWNFTKWAVFITDNRCLVFGFTYVHSHTTDTRPAVPLGLVLVVGTTSLQDGLVNTTTTCNHTCHTAEMVKRLGDPHHSNQGLETNSIIHDKLLVMSSVRYLGSLPTTALLAEEMTFLEPEGSLTLDFLVSGLWEITVA